MFQMCELSCSESPVDRLSRVGLILKADSHVAARLPIRIRRPINGLTFIKTDYLLLLFQFQIMYCLDYAERPHHCNLLSFILHELVFFGYHSWFASYLYVAATVRMHADQVFSSVDASPGASRMKAVI